MNLFRIGKMKSADESLKRKNVPSDANHPVERRPSQMLSVYEMGKSFPAPEEPAFNVFNSHYVNKTVQQNLSFTRQESVTSFTSCGTGYHGDTRARKNMTSWKEFTSNTTFHGVKYIFDGKPFKFRRFLWSLSVLAAVALFVYQVVDRTKDYLDYDTNVNVRVVYQDEMEFPRVTLCNQNTFRITKAVETNEYDYLNTMYESNVELGVTSGDDSEADKVIKQAPIDEVRMVLAHQKEDFIDSCTWKGRKCNLTSAVTTVITDFGVCQTFHGNIKSPVDSLNASQSGSGFALKLILNIEQYEYMKGPQDEAGIKVLLHRPGETALVKDLGFSVAPGTHTLVAVDREVIESLGAPYGDCLQTAEPRSNCIAACRAREIVKRCSCREGYMPEINDAPICSMTQAFGCVRFHLASMSKEEDNCECPVPCRSIRYEPILSYADLSTLSLDRLSLVDSDRRSNVWDKYRRAREVSQRMNEVIASEDYTMILSLLNMSRIFTSLVNRAQSSMRQPPDVTTSHGVDLHQFLKQAEPALKSDFNQILAVYANKMATSSTALFDFYSVGVLLSELEFFLGVKDRDDLIVLSNVLVECVNKNDSQAAEPSAGEDDVDSHWRFAFNSILNQEDKYYSCEDQQGYTYLYYKRRRVPDLRNMAKTSAQNLNDLEENYEEIIEYLFGDTKFDTRNTSASHWACKEHIRAMVETWAVQFETVAEVCEVYVNTSDWSEKYDITRKLEDFVSDLKNNSILLQDSHSVCNWYKSNTSEEMDDNTYGLFYAHAISALESTFQSQNILPSVHAQGEILQQQNQELKSMLSNLTYFLNGNMTKIDTYRFITSAKFRAVLQGTQAEFDTYMNYRRELANELSNIHKNVLKAFRYAGDFSPPVYNTSVLTKLATLQVMDGFGNHSLIGQLAEMRPEGLQETVLDSIEQIFESYYNEGNDLDLALTYSTTDLRNFITYAEENLEEYANGNTLDDKFFMTNYIKLDIFYKQLCYVNIKQQISFRFLSLLSEIGGFLGLLLGASVLTVCELVDYLALVTLRHCRQKQMSEVK